MKGYGGNMVATLKRVIKQDFSRQLQGKEIVHISYDKDYEQAHVIACSRFGNVYSFWFTVKGNRQEGLFIELDKYSLMEETLPVY